NRFCITCGTDLLASGPTAPAAPVMAPAAQVAPPVGVPAVAPSPYGGIPGGMGIPQAVPSSGPAVQSLRARLVLIRPDGTEGGTFQLNEGATLIGREAGQLFASDSYLSPRHA